jgi:hypothetical protein
MRRLVKATGLGVRQGGDDPYDALVLSVVKKAVADARQQRDPRLRQEAMTFLETCAPTVAERLRSEGVAECRDPKKEHEQ